MDDEKTYAKPIWEKRVIAIGKNIQISAWPCESGANFQLKKSYWNKAQNKWLVAKVFYAEDLPSVVYLCQKAMDFAEAEVERKKGTKGKPLAAEAEKALDDILGQADKPQVEAKPEDLNIDDIFG